MGRGEMPCRVVIAAIIAVIITGDSERIKYFLHITWDLSLFSSFLLFVSTISSPSHSNLEHAAGVLLRYSLPSNHLLHFVLFFPSAFHDETSPLLAGRRQHRGCRHRHRGQRGQPSSARGHGQRPALAGRRPPPPLGRGRGGDEQAAAPEEGREEGAVLLRACLAVVVAGPPAAGREVAASAAQARALVVRRGLKKYSRQRI